MALANCAMKKMLKATLLAATAASALLMSTSAGLAAGENVLAPSIPQDAKLYLSSNMLVYDRDHDKITASGAVRINYAGYKLVARTVTYDQASGRLIAEGKIELVEPTGNRIYADKLDITDDFGDGFVNSLRVETPDDTHFAAESGQKTSTDIFILHNGVYTACKPCAANPDKAPLWQVKAKKIIENGKEHTVRLEGTRFEFLGVPIAYLPFIEVPDHTVKRKSGFLFPSWSSAENLGFGMTVPYYQVFSPSLDATLNTTYYTKQGLLLNAQVRKRFESGEASLQMAGISQQRPSEFTAGTSDASEKQRGLIRTKGDFRLNSRWTYGWDVMVQSDNNFDRTYQIAHGDASTVTNQIYLTGLGDRNYFDLRGYYFDVQDADKTNASEWKQAFVHPVLDYQYFAPEPIAGGELSADMNFVNLTHRNFDVYSLGTTNRFRGVKGEYSRLSAEVEWRRQYMTENGLILTPLLAARGDAYQLALGDPSTSGYSYSGSLTSRSFATRAMLTAGLEARYPFLITMPGSQHVIEPIAQIYARNNEQLAGALPNDDAQSMVFDATNLFDRNKFSGYDRVEGGTRANLGVRYTGTFDNGFKVRGILGQSFQVAGLNSYATSDLVNAGANSGLEKKASDYVGLVGIETPQGIGLTESWRIDRESLQLARLDSSVSLNSKYVNTTLTYSRVKAQPEYAIPIDTDELQATTTIKVQDYWKLYAGVTWDLNHSLMNKGTFGISYEDECTTFAIGFSQTRDSSNTVANDWAVGARLTFRTLGDIKVGDASSTSF